MASVSDPLVAAAFSTFESTYPKGVVLNEDTVQLFEKCRANRQSLAFDEVTLEDKPAEFHPSDVQLHSFVTRRIRLKGCGVLSAAMDTVTEREMALAMAKMGGMGILHRNLDPETQASMVNWVRKKIHYGGMIDKPITFHPNDHYSKVQTEIALHGWPFTSFPVVTETGKLVGLITKDTFGFIEDTNPLLSEVMMTRAEIVTGPEDTNTEKAYQIMKKHRVKKLLIVNKEDQLQGMYVWSDVRSDQQKRELFSLDEEGHFLVGAAIGLGDGDIARAELLVQAGCKVLVLDSSHGACAPAKKQLETLRKKFGESVQIIVGNVASYDSTKYLLEGEYKPDAIKVGIGPGSICTTRSVTGHGIPQMTAIFEAWRAIRDHGNATGYYIPIIADGGIRNSGDIVKCLAVGASSVMLGSVLAGTKESPGNVIMKGGKRYKTIRGMGSKSAMAERSGSRGRYYRTASNQTAEELTTEQKEKMVAEGVEGLVEFKGSVEKVMTDLLGGIQSGLAHTGAPNIPAFQKKAALWFQSFAGMIEGRPHDISDIRD